MTVIDLPNGEYTGVVDAIEDGLATVFFEQENTEQGSAVIDPTLLPEAGRHADSILSVTIEDGTITAANYKPAKTTERAELAQNRFD